MEWVRWDNGTKPPSRNALCIWIYVDAPDIERKELIVPENFKLERDDQEIRVLWVDDDEVVDSTTYPLSIDSIDTIVGSNNPCPAPTSSALQCGCRQSTRRSRCCRSR